LRGGFQTLADPSLAPITVLTPSRKLHIFAAEIILEKPDGWLNVAGYVKEFTNLDSRARFMLFFPFYKTGG